ncbi:MAG: SDR family oxidoreductase [Alphaproteobacteria bacterium]|nr:MAG: SDR family oxidoreductase [Alphaproteobacteria bacterium]
MGRMEGKVAVITGAGSGIGRASARLFAKEGAKVVAADVNEEGLGETVEAINSDGGTAMAKPTDVGSEEAVQALLQTAIDTYGDLDAIYANAGITGGHQPLAETTVDTFQEVLRVNLIGPFLAIKHGGTYMASKGKGSIVCTASVAGLRSNAGPMPYSASKAGVISLVQTGAYHLYGTGVRINAICPGLIETGMTRPVFDMARERGVLNKVGQLNPLSRYGHPEEIANMALFLASDDASYVNGQAIPVCGGLSAGHPFTRPGRS